MVHALKRALSPPWRPVVQCYLQKHNLYSYHYDGLYEKSKVISGPRPVKYLEDRCCQHDEGNVEREAGRGAGTVDGENLIGIGGQR